MEKEWINGIQIYAPQNREELIEHAFHTKAILIAMNAEKILKAPKELIELTNQNIGYPDGVGAVWALKKRGVHAIKIPGCELWLDIIRTYHETKSFYFVGGTQETIEKVVQGLRQEYPDIAISGFRNGFLSLEERTHLIEDVHNKKPDIVFVAMGSPKQELLMAEMQKRHAAVYQGLGGSFDVYTGNVDRAPDWWVRNNLEWAYRLIKQPTRIKRQVGLLKFFMLLNLNRL